MTTGEFDDRRQCGPHPKIGDAERSAAPSSSSGKRGAHIGQDEVPVIVRDYLGGICVPELARRHRHTNRTISRILHEAGVMGTLQRRRDFARRGKPSPAHLAAVGLSCGPDAPEWPYIAGFFDGEGSIVRRDAAATWGDHRRYVVTIVQKERAPLIWMQQLFGVGTISFANGTHRYQVAGQRAVFAFLLAVLPHLIVKRKAAEVALAALRTAYGWDDGDAGDAGDERSRQRPDSQAARMCSGRASSSESGRGREGSTTRRHADDAWRTRIDFTR